MIVKPPDMVIDTKSTLIWFNDDMTAGYMDDYRTKKRAYRIAIDQHSTVFIQDSPDNPFWAFDYYNVNSGYLCDVMDMFHDAAYLKTVEPSGNELTYIRTESGKWNSYAYGVLDEQDAFLTYRMLGTERLVWVVTPDLNKPYKAALLKVIDTMVVEDTIFMPTVLSEEKLTLLL